MADTERGTKCPRCCVYHEITAASRCLRPRRITPNASSKIGFMKSDSVYFCERSMFGRLACLHSMHAGECRIVHVRWNRVNFPSMLGKIVNVRYRNLPGTVQKTGRFCTEQAPEHTDFKSACSREKGGGGIFSDRLPMQKPYSLFSPFPFFPCKLHRSKKWDYQMLLRR